MIEYKTEMARCTESNLVLHFTQRQGATIRHATVSIPLKALINSASVTSGLERAARRQLMEHWSGLDIDEAPLF